MHSARCRPILQRVSPQAGDLPEGSQGLSEAMPLENAPQTLGSTPQGSQNSGTYSPCAHHGIRYSMGSDHSPIFFDRLDSWWPILAAFIA